MQTLLNELTPQQETAFNTFLERNKANAFDFALLDAATQMPILDNNNLQHPTPMYGSRHIKGEVLVQSPEGNQVRLIYSKSTTQVNRNGVNMLEDVPESIWFEAGRQCVVSVPRSQKAWLARMLFSNECDNGINPAKVEPITGSVYRLIQPEKTAAAVADERRFRLRVQGMIEEQSPEENVLVAQRLQAHPSRKFRFDFADPNTLFGQLLDAVEVDTEAVYNATNDSSVKTLALVTQLQNAGLTRFAHETRNWETENGAVLLHVPGGEPAQGLAAWFADSQGGPSRKSLQNALDAKGKGKGAKADKGDKPKGIKLEEGQTPPEGYTKGPFGHYYPPADQE